MGTVVFSEVLWALLGKPRGVFRNGFDYRAYSPHGGSAPEQSPDQPERNLHANEAAGYIVAMYKEDAVRKRLVPISLDDRAKNLDVSRSGNIL